MIAGIRFRPQGQIYYFSASMDVVVGDAVVVKTEQGMGFGKVYFVCEHMPNDTLTMPSEPGGEIAQNEEMKKVLRESVDAMLSMEETHTLHDINGVDTDENVQKAPHTLHTLAPILRIATQEDCTTGEENQQLAKNAFAFCKKCIVRHKLDMKLVDVEIFFDRSKFMFYFTAPARIDFRELVKDLVREYRARIELRQIGVRHETQMVGAVGSCGMVCCCRRYLRKFAPVTIRMAKEQNLFLNPSKISGICGRLLCCLSYEQENYDTFYSRCPKVGKRYTTTQGAFRVIRTNMFKDSVSLLTENNEEVEMTLDEWRSVLPQFLERKHKDISYETGEKRHWATAATDMTVEADASNANMHEAPARRARDGDKHGPSSRSGHIDSERQQFTKNNADTTRHNVRHNALHDDVYVLQESQKAHGNEAEYEGKSSQKAQRKSPSQQTLKEVSDRAKSGAPSERRGKRKKYRGK